MSHEITDTDKVFTVGEAAWHGLDTNIKGDRLTAAQAREFLNWHVKKVQAEYEGKPVPGAFFTVREDTNAVLGVVGSQYTVIQNDNVFKLLEPVVDEGACIYETGGSLMGGRKVWALAKLPGEHYIVKDDRVNDYILVVIAHDGSMTFTAMHTSIRVVCNNTLSAALSFGGDAESPRISIKHMPGYQHQINIAHKILGLSTKASAQASVFFSELAVKAMSAEQLTKFSRYIFPSKREEEQKNADARIQLLRDRLMLGFEADINNLDPEHKHTAWAAYNSLTDMIDHDRPSRKGVDRMDWSLFGRGGDIRLKAINWLGKTFLGKGAAPEPEPQEVANDDVATE